MKNTFSTIKTLEEEKFALEEIQKALDEMARRVSWRLKSTLVTFPTLDIETLNREFVKAQKREREVTMDLVTLQNEWKFAESFENIYDISVAEIREVLQLDPLKDGLRSNTRKFLHLRQSIATNYQDQLFQITKALEKDFEDMLGINIALQNLEAQKEEVQKKSSENYKIVAQAEKEWQDVYTVIEKVNYTASEYIDILKKIVAERKA